MLPRGIVRRPGCPVPVPHGGRHTFGWIVVFSFALHLALIDRVTKEPEVIGLEDLTICREPPSFEDPWGSRELAIEQARYASIWRETPVESSQPACDPALLEIPGTTQLLSRQRRCRIGGRYGTMSTSAAVLVRYVASM